MLWDKQKGSLNQSGMLGKYPVGGTLQRYHGKNKGVLLKSDEPTVKSYLQIQIMQPSNFYFPDLDIFL